MADNRINFQVGYTVDKAGLSEISSALKKVQQEAASSSATGSLTKELETASKAAKELEGILNSSWNSKLNQLDLSKLNNGIKSSFGSVQNLKASFEGSGNVGAAAFNKISSSILNTNMQMKQTSKLLDSMAVSMANTVKWGITSSIFNNITGSIQKAWGYTQKLDASLNAIQIVSGKSADQMAKFAKNANDAAKALGATTTEYTDAALIYYQQGLSEEEVIARTNVTMKMANVLGESADKVSDYMTAIWNNFKSGSLTMEEYGDIITALGAKTAASSEEIAMGLEKFASAAEASGLSYEYATSALATVVATTRQSADTVGTAFKTIFARIQGLNLGETLDDGTTLNKYSEALSKVGISIKDQNGELKKMDDILDEMGSKWQTLNKDEQLALAQTVAGTRQYNQLVALMDNWGFMKENLEVAADATGTLNKQQETYMNSIEAHMKTLRAETEKTYSILFDTDTVNSFIDAADGLFKGLNNYLTGLDGGMNSIVHMGSVVANIFSNQIGRAINNSLINLEAYKANMDAIALKQQVIDAHAMKGETFIDGSSAVEKEATIAQQLLNVRSALTEEQYNELTNEQQKIGLLEQQIEEIQSYSIYLQANNLSEQSSAGILKSNVDIKKQELKAQQDLLRYLEMCEMEDAQRVKYQEELEILSNQVFNENSQMAELLAGMSTEQLDILEATQSTETTHEDIVKLIERQRELIAQQASNVKAGEAAILHKQQAEDGTLDRLRQEQNEREKLIRLQVQQAERQKLISSAVSGMMTLISLTTTLTGVVKTLGNENLSVGEKAQAILTTILTTLPMLIMNFKNIFKIIPGMAAGITSLAASMGAEAATTAMATGATLSLTEALAALWSVAWPYVAIAGTIAVAVGAIVLAVKAATDAYNADAIAMKNAKKHAEELKETYENTKNAAEELKSTISDYSDAIDNISKLDKSTNEYKETLIKANEKALELLKTYKGLAKYTTRGEDGLIVISQEGLDEILNQQLKNVSKSQIEYMEAEIQANSATLRSKITDFSRANKVDVKDWDTLSNKIITDIASYMAKNNIDTLIEDDLNKIDSIVDASDDVRQSIIENIEAYSGMGKQLNETREAQRLLARTCAEESAKLSGLTGSDETTDSKGAREDAAKLAIFNSRQVHYKLSQDEQDAAVQRYKDEKFVQFYGEDGMNTLGEVLTAAPMPLPGGGYVPGYDPTQVSHKDAAYYAALMGYDKGRWKKKKDGTYTTNNGRGWPTHTKGGLFGLFGTRYWDFHDENGKKISLTDEQLEQAIANEQQKIIDTEYAKIEAPKLLASIDTLLSKINIGTNDDVLDNLLLSADSGIVGASQSAISQQQAQDLLGNWDEIAAAFEGYDGITGFWKKQGFESAKAYLDAIKQWLTDRSNISDATAIGEEFINQTQGSMKKVISQMLSGDLTSENAESNEVYTGLVNQMNQLKELFPELTHDAEIFANTGLVGTEEWAQAAYNLQSKLNELKLQTLIESADVAEKKLDNLLNNNVDIEATLQSDEFKSALDELLNANYAIDVEIHAQAEEAFETFETATQNIAAQAAKIGENYVVAASDIRELNNAFPGIIQNMEDLGDGTVKLNEDIVKSAIGMANAETAASAEATLNQLENQALILRSKQAAYQAMADAALTLAKGEGDAAENTATIKQGFNELEALNNQAKSNEEMSNAQLVANDSYTQAGIMAKNWNSAYQSAANSAIAFANYAVAAAKSAQTGELSGKLSGDLSNDFGVTYIGQNAQSSEAAKLAELKDVADSANTKQDYLDLAAALQDAADAAGKQANDIEGMIAQVGAETIDVTNGFKNIADGQGKEGQGKDEDKKDKDSKEKDPDQMDPFTDKDVDVFREVDQEISKISKDLSSLQREEKRLTGKELLDNLNKQLKVLNSQRDVYAAKIKLAQQEADMLRNSLSNQGVAFNNDGTVANYQQALEAKQKYINDLIEQYNGMSADEQKEFKETVENAKKDYESFKKSMDEYDKYLLDVIPGLKEKIEETLEKEIEIQITKFNMAVEIRLDLTQAEKDWNEFNRRVIKGLNKDTDKGYLTGTVEETLANMGSYYNAQRTGQIQIGTDQVNKILDEIAIMNAGGHSDVYSAYDAETDTWVDNKAKALEDLKKNYEQLTQDLEQMEDYADAVDEAFLKSIDNVAAAFEQKSKILEFYSKQIDHDLKMTKLLYGDKAYDKIGERQERQLEHLEKQKNLIQEQTNYWKRLMDAAREAGDNEAYKKYRDNWMDSIDELNGKIEEWAELTKEKYANTVQKIIDNLNKEVTGGLGLDQVSEEWKLINKNADNYLDIINRAFALQSLENKWQDAINKTDSVSAQRKLNELMSEQMDMLREKDTLTQYDIDRANMEYEIALKQIALEEAQQNKSTMKLKRDANGNYSYQFVSDEDSILQAQQDLAEAQNKLYNFDKDAYQQNLDEIYSIWSEFQQKVADAYTEFADDQEALSEYIALLQEQYGEKINFLTEQNLSIRENLQESAFTELANMYETDVTNFQGMSDDEKDIIMNSLLPQWDSGVQHMTDKFIGDGGFVPACEDAFSQLGEAANDYREKTEEIGQMADEVSQQVESEHRILEHEAQNAIDAAEEEKQRIGEIREEVQGLIEDYKEARNAAIQAANAAYAYWTQEQKNSIAAVINDLNNPGGGDSGSGNGSGGGSGSGSGSSGGGDGKLSVGDTATFTGQYYYDSYGLTPIGSKYSGVANGVVIDNVNNNPYGIHIHSADGKYGDLGWVKKSQLSGYDTGGYTGEWDSSGRLALLHQKELVLNAHDTENMLNIVGIVRDLTDSLNNSMLSRAFGLMESIATNLTSVREVGSDTLEQDVHIEATFPNVHESREIENALNNLVNRASQFANRKQR